MILGVPTLFQMWLDAPGFAAADFSAVHFFISGGAPLPVPLVEAWRAQQPVVFRQGYGLTEVGPNCFSMTDAELFRKTGSGASRSSTARCGWWTRRRGWTCRQARPASC